MELACVTKYTVNSKQFKCNIASEDYIVHRQSSHHLRPSIICNSSSQLTLSSCLQCSSISPLQ